MTEAKSAMSAATRMAPRILYMVSCPLPTADGSGSGPCAARRAPKNWSGRPDSNRRRPAWEAGILPLNYGRSPPPILLLSCQTRARGRGTRAGPRVGRGRYGARDPCFGYCVGSGCQSVLVDRRRALSICVVECPVPRAPDPPRLPRSPNHTLLDRHLRGLDPLVAARLPGDALARAVEIELLVERRGGGVLDPELVDLVEERQPLLLVHLLLRGLHQPVEVRVRVRPELAAGAEERVVHRLGVDG